MDTTDAEVLHVIGMICVLVLLIVWIVAWYDMPTVALVGAVFGGACYVIGRTT